MVPQSFAVNQTKKTTNSGNSFHALILTSKEKQHTILEAVQEELLMFAKEKLKTNKLLSNGITMDTKIKFGSLNQSFDLICMICIFLKIYQYQYMIVLKFVNKKYYPYYL